MIRGRRWAKRTHSTPSCGDRTPPQFRVLPRLGRHDNVPDMPPRIWLTVLACALSPSLFGQDLTATNPQWLDPSDAPDTLPVFSKLRLPPVPAALKNATEYHLAEYRLAVSREGQVHVLSFATTSPFLELPSRFGTAAPARRNGEPVACEVVLHLIFNPKESRPDDRREAPRLVSVSSPVLPPALTTEGKPFTLSVGVSVDAAGAVTAVESPRDLPAQHHAAARAATSAVRSWRFEPAQPERGSPKAASVQVPVLFTPNTSLLHLSGLSEPPKALSQTRPVYPPSMRYAGMEGEVLVRFVVSVEGRVKDAHVARSNHPGFDEAAVEAVERWRFAPGRVDGRAVNTMMQVPVIFRIQGGGTPGFRVAKPRKFSPDTPLALQYEQPPVLRHYAVPHYPREALLAKQSGRVTVGFVVGPDGRVHRTEVIGDAPPDLAGAAIAAVEALEFTPPARRGEPCYAALRIEFDFHRAGNGDVPVTPEIFRLVRVLEKSPEELVPLSELDFSPEPYFRRSPVVPIAYRQKKHEGRATLEFIIDRKGFARLPRVISADDPALGYAAQQAVSTWRFAAPRKAGQPVDALVQIPIIFAAPAESVSPPSET